MIETTDEYQRYVTHALQMARESADVRLRRQWLNIADEWTVLAKARTETLALGMTGRDRVQMEARTDGHSHRTR